MWLSPRDQDKLLVVVAAELARKRMARGLLLNFPEATAILTDFVFEAARDGRSVEEIMVAGTTVLARNAVLPGVPALLREIQVEATFPDGTKLVTIHEPLGATDDDPLAPGAYLLDDTPENAREINVGKDPIQLSVCNTGDRPVQVGSHFHFYEVNPLLHFERPLAYGRRLAIAAGTAVRFEPNDRKTVTLIPFGGERAIFGHRGAVSGKLSEIQ